MMPSDHNIGTRTRKSAGKNGRRGTVAGVCLALGALALAGCGTSERQGFRAGCPNVGILRDAGTFRYNDPSGRPLATAVLADVQASCEYDDTGVAVSAILSIRAQTVEGADPASVPVEYFVAITDPNRTVLSKQIFRTSIDTARGVGTVEEGLAPYIPAPKTVDARYFEVLIGFQLPPEQLETNYQLNRR